MCSLESIEIIFRNENCHSNWLEQLWNQSHAIIQCEDWRHRWNEHLSFQDRSSDRASQFSWKARQHSTFCLFNYKISIICERKSLSYSAKWLKKQPSEQWMRHFQNCCLKFSWSLQSRHENSSLRAESYECEKSEEKSSEQSSMNENIQRKLSSDGGKHQWTGTCTIEQYFTQSELRHSEDQCWK